MQLFFFSLRFQNVVFWNTCVLYVTLYIPNKRKPAKIISKIYIKSTVFHNYLQMFSKSLAHLFKTKHTVAFV